MRRYPLAFPSILFVWLLCNGCFHDDDDAVVASFLTTGQNADLLLSGIDFNKTGGPLLFNHQSGLATSGTKLAVADRNNNRVLLWNTLPTGNTAPDLVAGQANFTTNDPGTGLNQMNWPVSVATNGTKLVVADSYNNRLLIWNTWPTQSGQAATFAIQGPDIEWPWGVWTNGTKLVATSTLKQKVLIWNSFPVDANDDSDIKLLGKKGGVAKFGTPRTITSDGTHLIIGDHNPVGQSTQGNFFWNSWPGNADSEYDYFSGAPFDPNNAWMQGDFTSDGKLILLGRRLHIWTSYPADKAAFDNVSNYYTVQPNGFEYDGGDGSDVKVNEVNGTKILMSPTNSNRLMVYNSIPADPTPLEDVVQSPNFVVGSPDLTTNTLVTNFFITNAVPATNGTSLFVVSDFDGKLFVWNTIPTTSGTHPNATYNLKQPNQDLSPWDLALRGNTLIAAGGNRVAIWNSLPVNGEAPNTILTSPIGSATLNGIRGVALDATYFYLAVETDNKVFVWQGIPSNGTNPAFSLTVTGPKRLSSDGKHLAVAKTNSNSVAIYDVASLSGSASPIGEVQGQLGVFSLNLPEEGLVHDGKVFVADTIRQRVLIWNSVSAATSNATPDVILGESTLNDLVPEIGRNKLFWPASLAYDGTALWVGEYKFSGRLVRYRP